MQGNNLKNIKPRDVHLICEFFRFFDDQINKKGLLKKILLNLVNNSCAIVLRYTFFINFFRKDPRTFFCCLPLIFQYTPGQRISMLR